MGKHIAFLLLGLVAGFCIFLALRSFGVLDGLSFLPDINAKTTVTLTTDMVAEAIEESGELTTTKYYYKDASYYESHKDLNGLVLPGTSNRTVFTYKGVVNLGVDLNLIESQIDYEAKVITVILPPIRIMSSELFEDSFEFVYQDVSILTPSTFQEITDMHGDLRKASEREVLKDAETIAEAKKNTQHAIESFLTKMDAAAGYTIQFNWKE